MIQPDDQGTIEFKERMKRLDESAGMLLSSHEKPQVKEKVSLQINFYRIILEAFAKDKDTTPEVVKEKLKVVSSIDEFCALCERTFKKREAFQ